MRVIKLPTSISRHADSTKRFAIAGAWFFLAFSFVSVVWALGRQWADPQGFTALYSATTEALGAETTHNAVGLSYGGIAGLLWALAQTLVVGLAAIMSILPRHRLRRLGHGVLIAWSALWMANLLWLASVDLDVASFGQATLMSALFGCTVLRAARGRRSAAPVFERETAPDETPEIVATDGTTTPVENEGPPLPRALRQRLANAPAKHLAPAALKQHARDTARRARPVAATAVENSRRGLRRLIHSARPALESARKSVRRTIARLQNGWGTGDVKS